MAQYQILLCLIQLILGAEYSYNALSHVLYLRLLQKLFFHNPSCHKSDTTKDSNLVHNYSKMEFIRVKLFSLFVNLLSACKALFSLSISPTSIIHRLTTYSKIQIEITPFVAPIQYNANNNLHNSIDRQILFEVQFKSPLVG